MNSPSGPPPLPPAKSGSRGRWIGWLCLIGALLATAVFLLLISRTGNFWSGKQAWEDCRRQLERRGEVLDWQAYIPPPVPDDDNIYAAPHIAGMLIKDGHDAYTEDLQQKYANATKAAVRHDTNAFCVVQLIVLLPGETASPDLTAKSSLTDTNLLKNIRHIFETTTGPRCHSGRGFGLLTRDPTLIQPAKIGLYCDQRPTIADLKRLFPNKDWPLKEDRIRIQPVSGTHNYELILDFGSLGWCQPKDYLLASAENEPAFELITNALIRPKVRLPGDYSNPGKIPIPIPGFVRLRDLAQELSSQTQCHLLLGQPDQALKPLTLLHGLHRFTLESQPQSLVTTMIGAAICGLYADSIGDGLRLNAWRESELILLQKQLQDIDLLPLLPETFRYERAAVCQTWEGLITSSPETANHPYRTARGWLVQNMFYYNLVKLAWMQQTNIDVYEATPGRIAPQPLEAIRRQLKQLDSGLNKYLPSFFLARLAITDPARTARTIANIQTKLNQAQVAIALERYRLAAGKYPDTLEQLAPHFIAKLPPDIIGGQPLKYHRTENGFMLYSIGWNEKDDGGQAGRPQDDSPGSYLTNGDWVWRQ